MRLKVLKNSKMAEGIMSKERLEHHNTDKILTHYKVVKGEEEKDSGLGFKTTTAVKETAISEGDEDKFEMVFDIRGFQKR